MAGRAGVNRKVTPGSLVRLVELREEGWTFEDIGVEIGVGRNTVSRYWRIYEDDIEEWQALTGAVVTDDGAYVRPEAELEELKHRLLHDWEFIVEGSPPSDKPFEELTAVERFKGQGLTVKDFHRKGWKHVEGRSRPAVQYPRSWGKSEIHGLAYCKQQILRSVEATRLHQAGKRIPKGWIPDISIAYISASKDAKNVRQVKNFLENLDIRTIWGDFKTSSEKWTDAEFTVAQRIYGGPNATMIALSVGTNVTTGLHPDIVILDDIVTYETTKTPAARQNTKSWIASTLEGICKADTIVILLNTPYHPEDFVSTSEKYKEYSFYKVPAIRKLKDGTEVSNWEELWPLLGGKRAYDGKLVEGLVDRRKRMDRNQPGSFQAQYQLDASAVTGARINVGDIKGITRRNLPKGMRILQFVDWAWTEKMRSDFSAIATVGLKDGHFYLIRVRQERLNTEILKAMIRQEFDAYKPREIWAEITGLQAREVKQILRDTSDLPWRRHTPSKKKEIRALPLQNVIETGNFFAIKDEPWYELFEEQLRIFPEGDYDDMVDAVSQAVTLLGRESGGFKERFAAFLKQ